MRGWLGWLENTTEDECMLFSTLIHHSMILSCYKNSIAIDHMTQISVEVLISSMATNLNDTLDFNLTALDNYTGWWYPFHDRKEPNRLSFSKSSSNVVYPIFDFISYQCLSKFYLIFAF